VNQPSTSTAQTREFSSLGHAAQVAVPLAVAWALIAVPVYWLSGPMGLAAAGIAALLCAFASIGAGAVAALLATSGQVVAATMLAMLLRMALPLVFVIIVCRQPGPLVDAGLVYYLIGFYLIALAADTRHAVGRIRTEIAASGNAAASRDITVSRGM
jgi:hypothetical protein